MQRQGTEAQDGTAWMKHRKGRGREVLVREVEYRRLGQGVAYFEPLHIQWLPCRREYMDLVEVEIAESHGGLVQFGTGRTLITFVFQRDV